MDVNTLAISLHPHAKDFLFQHYRTLTKIFSNVLGLLEIDYLSISLITPKHELLFLSSKPSIEANLIEHNLWQLDPCYQEIFYNQDKIQWWEELYCDQRLRYFKQTVNKFTMGLSIPAKFNEFHVVYSFGLKSSNEIIKKRIQNNIDKLNSIGKFCLQSILDTIPLPDRQRIYSVNRPQLKLVINNKVNYENNT